MVLHVIGAGFGRTGTSSLQIALEKLGLGPCYHITELFAHPEHAPLFDAAYRGLQADWDAIYDGYSSAVDFPTALFYKELLKKYPNAKVILTVRPSEEWYESVSQTLWQLHQLIRRSPDQKREAVEGVIDKMSWNGLFQGRFDDKSFAISVFESHITSVKKEVPTNRLLELDVRQGWNPLCQFLDVPVPSIPFPHANTRSVILSEVEVLRKNVESK